MDDKGLIRKDMKLKLNQLNHKEKVKYEQTFFNKIINTDEWLESKTIGITISTMIEWNTIHLINYAIKNEKHIAIPKSFPNRIMKFYKFSSLNELDKGFGGIYEPNIYHAEFVNKNDIDVLIVPGFAYDKEGYRIGFGGGYYDTYLEDFKGKTLSMAAEFQIIQHVPRNIYDKNVNKIITEQHTYKI